MDEGTQIAIVGLAGVLIGALLVFLPLILSERRK